MYQSFPKIARSDEPGPWSWLDRTTSRRDKAIRQYLPRRISHPGESVALPHVMATAPATNARKVI
jgi:hypothetical protein